MKDSFLFSAGSKKSQNGLTNGHDNIAGDVQILTDGGQDRHITDKSKPSSKLPIDFLTIFSIVGGSTWDLLEMAPLGKTYYDPESAAHQRYDVDISKGAIIVIRPDGWIGSRLTLDVDAVRSLEGYFKPFLTI